MQDQSTHESVEDGQESGGSFWADHLLQFNPSFALGHPYLQGQWGQYQTEKRQHLTKTVLTALLLVGVALLSTRLLFYWLYYIIPAVCVGYGVFGLRKWRKKSAQLAAREAQLTAASQVLKNGSSSLVQYSVEDIGQSKMHVLKNAMPHCRIVLEGAKSVPKYCGSWPIRNWRSLNESDRVGLHCEYGAYITGKAWHGVDQTIALLTDNGTVLWFV